MLDVTGLAKPLLDLLGSFGSGALPAHGAGDALRTTSTAIDQAHALGRGSINQLAASWSGHGADAATDKAMQVQTSAATLSDRGTSMAAVLEQAATHVHTGNKELTAIAQSFLRTAAAAGPTLTTPAGLSLVVGSAIDHFGQALTVVGRVQSQLSTQTAAMHELTPPPPGPPPVDPTAVAAPATSAVSTAASTAGGALSSLGNLSTQTASAGSPGSRFQPVSKTTTTGQGVRLKLPDGSEVVAPNEKAATAVRAALGAVGTPYVWGGNTPGAGLDCSGLTKYAYSQAGVELPRLADQQAGGTQVSPGDVAPGDLAVWDGHVAMVIGNGKFVEAGDPVQISSIRTSNEGMRFHGFFRPTS